MNSLKSVLSFIGLFAVFSLPIVFFYQAPKPLQAQTKLVKAERGLASISKPATKFCETIQRVRWKCESDKKGQQKCHRDGFDKVRHCKPL